jgi:hypothetical protein
MTRSAKSIAGAGIRIGALLLTFGLLIGRDVQSIPAAESSTVAAGDVTLHSVSVDLPDSGRPFPGGDSANAINDKCLACHSAGMVLTQPKLSRADWQAEVAKMRDTYKAPIAAEDVPAIVDYLVSLSAGK